MDALNFLQQMGWPDDRSSDAGQASWVGVDSDGLNQLVASISRDSRKIVARIDSTGLEGSESLLVLEVSVDKNAARITASRAGEPPEDIPAEDAVALFTFMTSGLLARKFTSTGPLDLPARGFTLSV